MGAQVTVDESAGGAVSGISVVICAYDDRRWDTLVRAVESLRAQTYPIDEIILVIDHNPGLFTRAQAEIENVVVVSNTNDTGLSNARNAGFENASMPIVAFLDDDAEATPDWVAKLVRLASRDKCLGAGGRAKPRWLTPPPRWFPDEFLWVVGCTYRGVPERLAPVRNLLGAGFCVRREVLRRLGGFRVELGRIGGDQMGCEETDLCIRANQAWPGHFFLYDPEAVIHHDVPSHRLTWQYFRARCFAEGASKARLATLVGQESALSAERSYVSGTLLSGIARSVVGAVQGNPARLLQAAAIVSGLTFTVAGYARERLRWQLETRGWRVRRSDTSPSSDRPRNEVSPPVTRHPE
jgi:glucosyl-dolichyl phosphate glucuronosyltransferase